MDKRKAISWMPSVIKIQVTMPPLRTIPITNVRPLLRDFKERSPEDCFSWDRIVVAIQIRNPAAVV